MIYLFLIVLSYLTNTFSIRIRTRFGAALGRLLSRFSKSRLNIAIDNLTHAFPDKSSDWINKTAVATFENLGIVLLEILALRTMSQEKIKNYIKFTNIDLFDKSYQNGSSTLMLSGHFGNWELLALGGGLYVKQQILIAVEPQRNQNINTDINNMRTRFGNRITSRYNAAREIVNGIKKNYLIALLVDQSASITKDIFVDFFGRPASTYEAPASLALRFRIPVIFGVMVRQDDGTYLVDPVTVPHDDLDDDKAGIEEFTRRHVKLLEKAIREHPEQWAWMHRRWKHQPPEGWSSNA